MSKKVEPVTRSDEFLAFQIDRLIKAHIEMIKELRRNNAILDEINRKLPDPNLAVVDKQPAEEEKPKRTVKPSAKKGE